MQNGMFQPIILFYGRKISKNPIWTKAAKLNAISFTSFYFTIMNLLKMYINIMKPKLLFTGMFCYLILLFYLQRTTNMFE